MCPLSPQFQHSHLPLLGYPVLLGFCWGGAALAVWQIGLIGLRWFLVLLVVAVHSLSDVSAALTLLPARLNDILLSITRRDSNSRARERACSRISAFSRLRYSRSTLSYKASIKCCTAKRSCTGEPKSCYVKSTTERISVASIGKLSSSNCRRFSSLAWCNSACSPHQSVAAVSPQFSNTACIPIPSAHKTVFCYRHEDSPLKTLLKMH